MYNITINYVSFFTIETKLFLYDQLPCKTSWSRFLPSANEGLTNLLHYSNFLYRCFAKKPYIPHRVIFTYPQWKNNFLYFKTIFALYINIYFNSNLIYYIIRKHLFLSNWFLFDFKVILIHIFFHHIQIEFLGALKINVILYFYQ